MELECKANRIIAQGSLSNVLRTAGKCLRGKSLHNLCCCMTAATVLSTDRKVEAGDEMPGPLGLVYVVGSEGQWSND